MHCLPTPMPADSLSVALYLLLALSTFFTGQLAYL